MAAYYEVISMNMRNCDLFFFTVFPMFLGNILVHGSFLDMLDVMLFCIPVNQL